MKKRLQICFYLLGMLCYAQISLAQIPKDYKGKPFNYHKIPAIGIIGLRPQLEKLFSLLRA